MHGIEKITQNPSRDDVEKIVKSLHWDDISWAILKIDKKNRIECSGSINDGFAIIYQENDSDYIGNNAPESIDEIIEILIQYLNYDNSWKNKFTWKSHTIEKGKPVKKGLFANLFQVIKNMNKTYIIYILFFLIVYFYSVYFQ